MAAENIRAAIWGQIETMALVEIWRNEDVEAQLEGVKRNIGVYEMIAEKLREKGYERTATQCRSKLKSLKHDYNQLKKSNGRSGHGARPLNPIMVILDEVLGVRPLTCPHRVVDVAARNMPDDTGEDREEMSDTEDDGPRAAGENIDIDNPPPRVRHVGLPRPRQTEAVENRRNETGNKDITAASGSKADEEDRKATMNDFTNKKSRKRKANDSSSKMVTLFEGFMSQQAKSQESMLQREDEIRLREQAAERESRREESDNQLKMMQMMMSFFGNQNGQSGHPMMPGGQVAMNQQYPMQNFSMPTSPVNQLQMSVQRTPINPMSPTSPGTSQSQYEYSAPTTPQNANHSEPLQRRNIFTSFRSTFDMLEDDEEI